MKEYPKYLKSTHSVTFRKAVKLASALADDWWNHVKNTGDVEWINTIVSADIGQYRSLDDDTESETEYTLIFTVDDTQIEVWYNFESNSVLVDLIIEEHLNTNESSDLSETNLSLWVSKVEQKMDNIELLESIYEEENEEIETYDE